jgi:hypothetical protein
MFRTNNDRAGSELYPHGGLYPEEVIVPWWVFLRDAQEPQLVIHLFGQGRSGLPGNAELRVQNLSEIEAPVVRVSLALSSGRRIESVDTFNCTPVFESRFQIPIDNWPTSQELRNAVCHVEMQLPRGRVMDITAVVVLSSEEMYTRDESLLEGLDL